MLGGFLHICTCTCTIYYGLWPLDNTTCLFLTWYQSGFSHDRRRQFAPASLSPVPVLAAAAVFIFFRSPSSDLVDLGVVLAGRPSSSPLVPIDLQLLEAAPVPAPCGLTWPASKSASPPLDPVTLDRVAYTQWMDENARAAAVLTSSVRPQYASEFMGLPTVAA
jgi:hypothetical protein